MALDAAKNTLHGWYKSTVEYVTPINEKSEFKEKGVLTPEEFLTAGCQLVYKCPTWSWEGGDAKKRKPYFPDNQQYLISRNLPCLQRVAALMTTAANNEHEVEQGEWLNMDDSDKAAKGDDSMPEIADIDLDAVADSPAQPDAEQKVNAPQQAQAQIETTVDDEDDDFEHIPDIDDFDDGDNVVSAAATGTGSSAAQLKADAEEQKEAQASDSRIVRTRTYDVSITYDKYYRVPRVWLRGYDENGSPLSSSAIFEDISADHAHKTVTVEPHSHSGVVCASIHPCRHSEVMKRFMSKLEESGKRMSIDQYLFLFLKFMSAVIPTIQYDFTQSVEST